MGGKSKNPEFFSQEKLKKAKLKEKAINLIEKKGIEVEKAFKTFGLEISPFTYPRIYRRYKEKGLEGLIDKRGGKRIEKLTASVKNYILSVKKEHDKLAASQIRKMVFKRFNLEVHISSVSNFLKEEGLNNPKGRPRKEIKEASEIPIDHAGGFLIKGALINMDLVKVIVDRIKKRTDEIRKNVENDLKWMAVLSAGRKAISHKIESLLYMPIFQMERIWHFKTVYPRDGLGALSGTGLPYKYHTMDKFLREISLLGIDK